MPDCENNIFTIGEIVAEYMARFEIRIELQKLQFSGYVSLETLASEEQGISREPIG